MLSAFLPAVCLLLILAILESGASNSNAAGTFALGNRLRRYPTQGTQLGLLRRAVFFMCSVAERLLWTAIGRGCVKSAPHRRGHLRGLQCGHLYRSIAYQDAPSSKALDGADLINRIGSRLQQLNPCLYLCESLRSWNDETIVLPVLCRPIHQRRQTKRAMRDRQRPEAPLASATGP